MQTDQMNVAVAPETACVESYGTFFRSWSVSISLVVALLLGGINGLVHRHSMNPDGISYLDLSDLILKGHWIQATNAYWAPLYPVALAVVRAIVRPSTYWEFSTAQLTDFLMYIGALAAFSVLLKTLLEYLNYLAPEAAVDYPLPQWLWVILGYTFFVWCSLELIGGGHVDTDMNHPDMLLSIFLYLATATLMRIKMGSVTPKTYLVLGTILGLGYWAKSPMFPLAAAFLVTSVLAAGSRVKGLQLGALAAVIFLAISCPLVYAISKETGHLTFGDNAQINYTSNVNQLPKYYWVKNPPDPSIPIRKYPAEQLFAHPAVYRFTMPLRGTYVYWFNPAEWYRGTKSNFSFRDNSRQLLINLGSLYNLFFHTLPILTFALLSLSVFNHMRGRSVLADLYRQWVILAVPVFGLTMYTAVFFVYRHVGSLFLLLFLGLFGSMCLPSSRDAQRATIAIVLVLILMMGLPLLMHGISGIGSLNLAEFSGQPSKRTNIQWEIADDLRQAGLKPGDAVAWLRPDHFDEIDNYYWARPGRFQITAEIADNAAFWSVDDSTRSAAIQSLSHAGVKALVLNGVPNSVKLPDFVKLGNTGYYVYLFRKAS